MDNRRKPVIGLTTSHNVQTDETHQTPYCSRAILAAGGIPVILPLEAGEDDLRQLVQMMDGFLFTGGPDVHPSFFGEETREGCGEVSIKRDRMELALLRLAMEQKKPILGICRGIQLINVGLGGTIYQDIPSQAERVYPIAHSQPFPHRIPSHSVKVTADSRLAKILSGEIFSEGGTPSPQSATSTARFGSASPQATASAAESGASSPLSATPTARFDSAFPQATASAAESEVSSSQTATSTSDGSSLWSEQGVRQPHPADFLDREDGSSSLTLWVNSTHHQAVREPAPGLTAYAFAPDGIIEGVVMETYPYLVGVQWHPEYLWETDPAAANLFKSLVQASLLQP